MKNGNEHNDYGIKNPDGASKEKYGERKTFYRNDQPRFVAEEPMAKQREWDSSVRETPELKKRKPRSQENAAQTGGVKGAEEQVASALNATATAAQSAATAAATTVGGGVGALVGVVATTVATAVIVVATFISMLSIDVSLLLAESNKLVFQLSMQGAQEEDFETSIVAVLRGGGDTFEQPIGPDSYYLTFENLKPDSEYSLLIENSEGKIFVNRTYRTAAASVERATLSASIVRENERDVVYIRVENVSLSSTQFYTVTAGDGRGGTLFAADDVEKNKQFSFVLSSPSDVYVSLSVAGKTYATSQVEYKKGPEYDLSAPLWTWNGNEATLSFAKIGGGEPLLLAAVVNKDSELAPMCEVGGEIKYIATAEYDGIRYSDEKTETINALGHTYGEPVFNWTPVYAMEAGNAAGGPVTADDLPSTPVGYTVTATFTCQRNPAHTHVLEIPQEDVTHEIVPSSCEADGSVTYYASFTFLKKDYSDTRVDVLEAIGHRYDDPTFTWEGTLVEEEIVGYTATATFTCLNDSSHKVVLDAEITTEETPPGCVSDGYVTYFASVGFSGMPYFDSKDLVFEETALGHELELQPAVEATFSSPGNMEYWLCSRCGKAFTDESGHEELEDVTIPVLTGFDGKIFTAWNEAGSLPTDTGSYYLTADVWLEETWEIGEGKEIDLCLNGHYIRVSGCRFLNLGQNAVFGLYECDHTLTHNYLISSDSYYAYEVDVSQEIYDMSDNKKGTFNGGYIRGGGQGSGGAIMASVGSVVNLKGGTIIGFIAYDGDGGAYYSAPGVMATVNLAGTDFIGNVAENGAGGAICSYSGVVTMSAGRLLYNSASEGGAVRVPDPGAENGGTFTMTGGVMSGNAARQVKVDGVWKGGNGGAVYIDRGTFTMTGGEIIGNSAEYGAGVCMPEDTGNSNGISNGEFIMEGGIINENTGFIGLGVYVGSFNHKFCLSGDATVMGNVNDDELPSNVYLSYETYITVSGEFTGTVGVTLADTIGQVTSGYAEYHEGAEPSGFISDGEFGVDLIEGEVSFVGIKVCFDTDGIGSVEIQYLPADGGYAYEPDPPQDSFHTFDDWYEDRDGLRPFDFENTFITEQTTIYAKWS